MNNPKISIIMPSKNMEKYIGKCLESVQNQSLSDIEILCVDAMSSDNTRGIIKKYASEDSRIRLLDDTKGSSGYADNYGFKEARGRYVAIVETDDCIKNNMMEVLYNKAEEYQLDYIKADFSMFVEPDGQRLMADCIQPLEDMGINNKVIDTREYPQLLERDGYLWRGIYRRSFILDNHLWLNESKGAAYQDNGFLHRTIMHGRRVMYIPDSFYQYRRDNEGSSDYNPKGLEMMAKEYGFIEADRRNNPDLFDPFLPVYYYKMFHQFKGQARKARNGYEATKQWIGKFHDWMEEALAKGLVEPQIFKGEMEEVKFFVDSPREFMYSYWEKHDFEMETYRKFINNIDAMNNEFVIVSAGIRGKGMLMLLARNLPLKNYCICDNSKTKQGECVCNQTVLSVEDAIKKHPHATYVVTNEKYAGELKVQLLEAGVGEDDIFVWEEPIDVHFGSSFST